MSDDRSAFWSSLLSHAGSFVLSLGVTVIAAKIIAASLEGPQDGNGDVSEKMTIAKQEWAKKHGAGSLFPELSSFEQTVMQDMIFPSQINASFDDIGGLDQTKRDLFETVLLPLTHPHLYQSMNSAFPGSNNLGTSGAFSPINSLLSAPTGVLFYGPPGCGKTIMAKAIAQSANCTFIQCNFATLISKYYGESEKFIASLFSVARKFSPAIIFIDEVDMYLGKRGTGDREQESRMKAQFLSLWDGLTSHGGSVLVLGATNRPFDLDEAILRRFSKQILFDLPSPQERLHILNVLLSGHVALEDGTIEYIAAKTNGFSGSDLKELSKRAAMEAVREHIYKLHQRNNAMNNSNNGGAANNGTSGGDLSSSSSNLLMSSSQDQGRPRPTTKADFDLALKEVQPTGQRSMEYLKNFYQSSGLPTRFVQQQPLSSSSSQPTTGQQPKSSAATRPLPPLIQPTVSFSLGGATNKPPTKKKTTASTIKKDSNSTTTAAAAATTTPPQPATSTLTTPDNDNEDAEEYQEINPE